MLAYLALYVIGVVAYNPPIKSFHQVYMHGNLSLGYYYVNIYLGTPPQRQTFIVDTGSSLFAVPCSQCDTCGIKHMNPKFDIHKSSTNILLTCGTGGQLCLDCQEKQPNSRCEFTAKYAQGSSFSGFMVSDKVLIQDWMQREDEQKFQISEAQSLRTTIGCVDKETNLFLNQKADGILGLGPDPVSDILTQIKTKHGPITKEDQSFSICLAQNGGLLTVGGLNPNVQMVGQNRIVVKFRKDQMRYSLMIDDVYIGKVQLRISPQQVSKNSGIVLDSGTTYTYFPSQYYNEIVQNIQDECNIVGCQNIQDDVSKCYNFPDKFQGQPVDFKYQLDRLPSIDLKVGKQRISWNSSNYLLVRSEAKRQVCLGFMSLNRWILGTTWMVNRNLHFNHTCQEITILDIQCPSSQIRKPQNRFRCLFGRHYQHSNWITVRKAVIVLICIILGVVVIMVILLAAFIYLRRFYRSTTECFDSQLLSMIDSVDPSQEEINTLSRVEI